MLQPHSLQPRHVRSRTERGILVLTITEPQLLGDKLVHALRQEMMAVIAPPDTRKIVLDLQPVKVLSSEAFRPLLTLRRAMQERGGQLVLCNLAPTVAKVLHETRLITTSRSSGAAFAVQADVATAVASLADTAGEQQLR
jgi:anti-anti-sigma factor